MEKNTGSGFVNLVKFEPPGESIFEDIPNDIITYGYTTSYDYWLGTVRGDKDISEEEFLLNKEYGKKFKEFMINPCAVKSGKTLTAKTRELKTLKELDTISEAILYRICPYWKLISGGANSETLLPTGEPEVLSLGYKVRYAT